jgi:hypothetical protein
VELVSPYFVKECGGVRVSSVRNGDQRSAYQHFRFTV